MRQEKKPPPTRAVRDGFHLTDTDGTRWNPDAGGLVDQLAKKTARTILHEAADEPDGGRSKELATFAYRSESAAKRRDMLTLARSEPGIPVKPDELDNEPWKLNCPNGTINLKLGKLCEHRRDDKLTQLCPVPFDPDAEAPIWEQFLTDVFCDSELVGFVQRLAGYCLTGRTTEHVLPILWGSGCNGKSTFVGAMLDLLGDDYAGKAPQDLLMAKRTDFHPTALANLHGKRLIACVETGEGRRLAESLVKELTGGDKLTARRMREDYWQFDPTHKVLLATNHRPEIRDTTHALWRRVKLLPFNTTIPDHDQDTELPDKLRAELPGILRWAVQGCLAWQRDGLGEPEEVKTATAGYRQSQDNIAGFIADCCVVGAFTAKASELLDAYREWSGDKRITQRRFGGYMTEREFERFTNNGTWYRGLALARE